MVESAWGNTSPTERSDVKVQSNVLFKDIKETKLNRGIKILSYGGFSTGKTHFALTTTTENKPVYIMDTENGASPLADLFPQAKILKISEKSNDDTDDKDDVKNFDLFRDAVDYLSRLPDDQLGTIIIDSVSDIWDWAQCYAKTKIFKIPIEDRFKQQWDWQVPNKLYLKQIMKLININANIIFCARAGEEFSGPGQSLGTFKPQCQKKTPFYVDVVLYHDLRFTKAAPSFFARIEKCRENGNIVGRTFEDPSFQKLKDIIYTKEQK